MGLTPLGVQFQFHHATNYYGLSRPILERRELYDDGYTPDGESAMSVGPRFPLEVINVADDEDTDGTPRKKVYLIDPETDRHFHVDFKRVSPMEAGISLRTDAKYDGPYWELSGYGSGGGDRKGMFAAIGQAVRYLSRYKNLHVHERPHGNAGKREDREPDYTTAQSPTGYKTHIFAAGDNMSLCGNTDMTMWARPMPDDFDPDSATVCKTCSNVYTDREDDE